MCIISTSAFINTNPLELHVMTPYGVRDATGNPANIGEGNCRGCHSGTLNSGGSLQIVVKDANNNPVSTYEFNKLYTVSVTVARTGISTFGFDAEVVTKNNSDAGVITSLDSTKIITLNGCRSTNMTHATPGKTKNSHTFMFQWKTPAADSGIVTIYAGGLAANGNGTSTGDYTYTNVKKLNPNSSASINESQHVISSVSIYPNPVAQEFNLTYELKSQGNLRVDLYALTGQKVAELLQENKYSGFQHDRIVLPVSLKNGIYMLQLNINSGTTYEKIVIDKK